MSGAGSDLSSLTLAIADLKAIDARLSALGSAESPIQSDGVDLTAAIRQSQELVRAAIAQLSGARTPNQGPVEKSEQNAGSAKRRVKIKAASDTTEPDNPARAEPSAAKASGKSANRGGDRSRDTVAAAASATASTPKAPASSLLARLGAATAEPDARNRVEAPAQKSATPPTHETADRLARLEAEIDNLTTGATAADGRAKAEASSTPTAPTATKTADVPPRPATAAKPLPAPEHRPGVGDGGDEDDAEIVIVNAQTKAKGAVEYSASSTRPGSRVVHDPALSDDEDAEVEIVQSGARQESGARSPATPVRDRVNSSATAPTAPSKWRLFRGSR